MRQIPTCVHGISLFNGDFCEECEKAAKESFPQAASPQEQKQTHAEIVADEISKYQPPRSERGILRIGRSVIASPANRVVVRWDALRTRPVSRLAPGPMTPQKIQQKLARSPTLRDVPVIFLLQGCGKAA